MTWEEIFNQIKDKKYFVDLLKFIDEEYKNKFIEFIKAIIEFLKIKRFKRTI